ncbi:Signal transduction histidine kinase [Nonlabens sp. Hel1_33_55]|nr:Signal transduction histidine kinase [Nonlabens sp. Hel1_33_55]
MLLTFAILLLGTNGMAQEPDSRLSQEGQQIAVDAMLERANLELQSNRFPEAQRTLQAAKEIASDSLIYLNTEVVESNFFIYTGQLEQAQKNIDRLKKQIPITSASYVELLLIQADIYIRNKEYLQADEILKTINIALDKSKDAVNALKARYLLANLYLSTANYTQALSIYQEIIPQLREQSLFYFESKSTFNLAETYFENGEFENANRTVDQALASADNYGFTGITLSCYYLKSTIAKGLGDFEQAMIFLEKYQQLREDQFTDTSSNAISIGSIEKVSELEQQILAKNKVISDQEIKLKGRGFQNILFFVLLTLLSLLTMSLFKNNKLRAKSNQTLEGKNSALIDERDRAQDAAKIKADFLSTITHELRTPMYAVTGLTHLLLETEPRHDQREHLETLQSSGEYLLSLIDNILDFNKLEANKVELEQIPFDLKKRVEDITTSLSNQSKDQGNSLSLEFDNSIPSRIKGDPVKMSQILINLVGNAIKFTKNGNVWIRVDQVKQVEDRCLIHFEVEDNGKGISEEKQQDIFNNFTQEGSSTTREYGGTGLGLAIVKNLVSLMGSQINLDSKIGRGSIFSFDLWFELPDTNKFYEDKNLKIFDTAPEEEYPEYKKPVRTAKPESKKAPIAPINTEKQEPEPTSIVDDENQQKDRANAENLEPSDNKNKDVIGLKKATATELISKKILIVEDNKINQMITRKILEGKNFDCDIANNGIEALGKIKDNTYDLILMDIHMPGMDGKQCTREVRKFDRELPIIALTAVTLDESEKEFYEIGFDDIIPKPFKMDEFFDKIQKAFTNYQIY